MTTLTIVDMAGYPAQSVSEQALVGSPSNHLNAYSDSHSEVNTQGVNYLMYVFKDMMFKGNTKGKGKPLHGNTHSKVLKEFTHLVTTGTNKISFMQFCDSNVAKSGKQSNVTRYNTFIDKQLAEVRLPVVRSTIKIESVEHFTQLGTNIAKSSTQNTYGHANQKRRTIIEFGDVLETQQEEVQARIEANLRVHQSNSRERLKAGRQTEDNTLALEGSITVQDQRAMTF